MDGSTAPAAPVPAPEATGPVVVLATPAMLPGCAAVRLRLATWGAAVRGLTGPGARTGRARTGAGPTTAGALGEKAGCAGAKCAGAGRAEAEAGWVGAADGRGSALGLCPLSAGPCHPGLLACSTPPGPLSSTAGAVAASCGPVVAEDGWGREGGENNSEAELAACAGFCGLLPYSGVEGGKALFNILARDEVSMLGSSRGALLPLVWEAAARRTRTVRARGWSPWASSRVGRWDWSRSQTTCAAGTAQHSDTRIGHGCQRGVK